jgi:hypothetical protein
MNGTIYFRADHELVGRVIAEKLRRKNDRSCLDYPESVRPAQPVRAKARKVVG